MEGVSKLSELESSVHLKKENGGKTEKYIHRFTREVKYAKRRGANRKVINEKHL